jgi:hypothetical protein
LKRTYALVNVGWISISDDTNRDVHG